MTVDRSPPAALPDAQPDLALAAGLRTIDAEIEALAILRQALERDAQAQSFRQATALIAGSRGRVVVSGMGKSGLVGRKIAATLASTGTPAFFIHPAEASHGDLGMITRDDVVLAISWSGETAELSDIVSYSHRFEVPVIALTAGEASTLARAAGIVLLLPRVPEACPNQLAPTSSTIVQSAMGDALAVALITVRGFSPGDFRIFHPKGRLGAQLLRVADLMSDGDRVPRVAEDASILAAMLEMSEKRLGITGIVAGDGTLVGGFTDGDLRRSLTTASVDAAVRDFMTAAPLTITSDQLASEALAVMNSHNVTQLFVAERARLIGVIHLHDILHAGVV